MASTLPPDPYKLLGVPTDAKLPEIRSAHRKLVLKCHPDKVQDAALKAVKQDEFQKVQQAYELLSDDARRLQYDEQVKLFELRKEMGRGVPPGRTNPFDFEVKTAEYREPPRKTSYARPMPNPYTYPTAVPRSHEDLYDEPLRHTPKKSSSYESTDRKRTSTRDAERYHDDLKREDERRQKFEKEARRATEEKKKSRNKEKRNKSEEKIRRTYVEDDSDEDYRPRSSEKKTNRHKIEEDMRAREEAARFLDRERERAEAARAESRRAEAVREAERETQRAAIKGGLPPKWDAHAEYAGQYMQAARRKAVPEQFSHPGMPKRADTFTAATAAYDVRYATPTRQFSDDDSPKRSSARRETRRASDTPAPRSREKSSRRRSPPPPHPRDPYIVEPPSPSFMKPPLQSHNSAPAASFPHSLPTRSKTQDYPRAEAIPPLARASTFQSGDRDRARDSGSRLKKTVEYSSDSEPDSPVYKKSPRHSHSPPPRQRATEQTRYKIDNGRANPVDSRHRSDLRDLNEDYGRARDRSESPRGTTRPPLTRNPPSSERPRATPVRSSSQTYYDQPEPIIYTPVRPQMHREGSGRHGSSRNVPLYGEVPPYKEVKYAKQFGAEHIIYGPNPDPYRRDSDPSHHRSYYQTQRGERAVFA
jgi:curved DNA-binding protein CbpA